MEILKNQLVGASANVGVMGHVVADYPSKDDCRALIETMVTAGIAMIEIQIPYSEPIADGPLFLKANHQALENGVELADCFDLMAEVTTKFPEVPFVFMSYVNPIFCFGFKKFVQKAARVGARGVIVPDLPPESAQEFLAECREKKFSNIVVIPPNVTDDRLKALVSNGSGLIYVVARSGVTGVKTEFSTELDGLLKRIRAVTKLPLAVGFGIQNRDDVEYLQGRSELAVIGSQGLRVFQEEGLQGARAFWSSVCGQTRG